MTTYDGLIKRLEASRAQWSNAKGVPTDLEAEAATALTALQQRNAELEEALRFYADPDKYTDCAEDVPDFYVELDFGETARAALKPTR